MRAPIPHPLLDGGSVREMLENVLRHDALLLAGADVLARGVSDLDRPIGALLLEHVRVRHHDDVLVPLRRCRIEDVTVNSEQWVRLMRLDVRGDAPLARGAGLGTLAERRAGAA